MKAALLPVVSETSAELGWRADSGMIHALGAILLTGYLGGTVATHVRVGSPLFSHALFGVYPGIIVWGGLWLRDPRLRALIPLRA